MNLKTHRQCDHCDKMFVQRTRVHRFCSNKCRSAETMHLYIKKGGKAKDRRKIGAASEMVVAGDFLRHGAHVFRALSPDAPFDLVALVGDELLRVQVKTNNYIGCERKAPDRSSFEKESGRFDIYAEVRPDGIDYYLPDLSLVTIGEVAPDGYSEGGGL